MFLHSQSGPERAHLVEACRFELGKVERLAVRERVVALFGEIEPRFAAEVAAAIGVKPGKPARQPPVARPTGTPAPAQGRAGAAPASSPALSLANQPHPGIRTRKVALLAAAGVSRRDVDEVQGALLAAGACVEIISSALGPLPTDEGRPCDATRTFLTTASVLYDAVYVPGGARSLETLLSLEAARDFVRDSYRHAKPVGASNEGIALLLAADLPRLELAGASSGARTLVDRGVVSATAREPAELLAFATSFIDAIRKHRHFDRFEPTPTRPRPPGRRKQRKSS
jgi:catalase